VQALVAELEKSRGANRWLDHAVDDVKPRLAGPPDEALARRLVETLALALQGAVLLESAPDFVADAFCATRLCDRPSLSYGAIGAKVDVDALIDRAMPRS
jgi:putative acyl-CoA dehydrogenase